MKTHLTDRGLKALKPRDKPYDVMDDDVRAFGVRVLPTGEISFILRRRFPGSTKPTRRALCRYGEKTLSEARELARDWLAQIKKGTDPTHAAKRVELARIEAEREARAREEAERARRSNTVEAALTAYFANKSGLRSIRSREIEMRRELATWLNRPLLDIARRDVRELIINIKNRGARGQARAMLTLVKAFFAWCVENSEDYGFNLQASPAAGIKLASFELGSNEVTRVLANHEIASLWRACDVLGYPWGDYFRLLLLSSLRRVEAARASWLEFEGDRWVIPMERMKGNRPHLVPVTPAIARLLSGLPRYESGTFLFSNTLGATPISAFGRAKEALDAAMRADLEANGHAFLSFTIHDIRRTCRSKFGELGIAEHIGERLLAHAQPELQRRYNVYGYEEQKRDGLERWHAALEDIVEGRPTGNVLPMPLRA